MDEAVRSAHAAFPGWWETPAVDRVQVLFRFKSLLESHVDELVTPVSTEHGKTLSEACGDVRRGIQMVEYSPSIPSLLMGDSLENVAKGIDCDAVRQPLGVCAGITPFNFPAMVPLWMFPPAIACGNTFVLKPSEKVPLTAVRLTELLAEAGLPSGVFQLVHGGRKAVDALLTHPVVQAIPSWGRPRWPKKFSSKAPRMENGCGRRAAGGGRRKKFRPPDAGRPGGRSGPRPRRGGFRLCRRTVHVQPGSTPWKEEIFGPVLSILRTDDLDAAIELANRSGYGNGAAIFTRSGHAAREFKHRIQSGMVGINIGVPAAMAMFPFSGWNESFFGDLHLQGLEAVAFYTRQKVTTSRWFGTADVWAG